MSTWLSLSFEYNTRFLDQINEKELNGIRFYQNLFIDEMDSSEISTWIYRSASAYVIYSIIANILRRFIFEHEKMKLQYHFGSNFEKEENIERIIKVIMTFLG